MTRHSAFGRLWAAAGLSNLGDGVGLVAVPLLAATLTRDPAVVGGLVGTLFLPHLLLGVVAGALVDRVQRRTAMLAANLGRTLALAALCVGLVGDVVSVPWLYALVFVLGASECVYDAAADGFVPHLVDPQRLDGANARLQGTITVTNSFLGAPLGAVLFSTAAVAPFGLQAVLLVGATVLVATLPRLARRQHRGPAADLTETDDAAPPARRVGVRDVLGDVREGLAWLWGQRGLRTLAGVSAGMAFANQLAQSTLVLYVIGVLGLPAAWLSGFAVTAAVGALLGATVAPRLGRRLGRLPAMLTAATLEVVALALMGVAPGAVVAGCAFALFAFGVGTWNVLSMSLRQQLVPSHLFGRLHGAWRTLVWGALPLGAWLGGVIAGAGGLRAPWLVGAAVFAVVMLLGVPSLHRAGMLTRTTALDDDDLNGATDATDDDTDLVPR